MQVRLIDLTLREGLQMPGEGVFLDDETQVDYIEAALESEVIERYETSMPWARLPYTTWDTLTASALEHAQIYVGPSHTFNIAERPELALLEGRLLLSTTLIQKDRESIQSLAAITSAVDDAALRVGVECVGLVSIDETLSILGALAEQQDVEYVALSDSNGLMSHEWIYNFFTRLEGYEFPFSLGFHLHNAPELDAYTKAQVICDAAQAVRMSSVEFDVTLCGVGDRLGILALQDAVYLDSDSERQQRVNALFQRLQPRLRAVMDTELMHGTDNGRSHFSGTGELRPEYSK